MRLAAALPLILAIVIFARCDRSFEPDVDESLSEEVRGKRINTVKTWYYSELSEKQNAIPVLPDGAVSKTLSDSTIASVLSAMVSKYPPNWDVAETWSNGHGGFYMATIHGFNESTTSASDSRISVIRTFVADVD